MNFTYYDAEGGFYPNRLAAMQSGKRCFLNWNDLALSTVHWKQEPTPNLQTLYKRRAEYIRSTYEWVALAYSGGVDSTNVLESFYYNDIPIDEIIVFGAFDQDEYHESDENHNAEVYKNVLPTLKQLDLPDTKITIYDYSLDIKRMNEMPIIQQYGSDWAFHVGGAKSLTHIFWNNVPNIMDRRSKNRCLVFGTDKPWILKHNVTGNLYTVVYDTSFEDYGRVMKTDDFERVNFYTDPHPTATDIWRKQCHVIKNYYRETGDENYNVMRVFEPLIYDLKHPLIFKAGKSKQMIISRRDQFIKKHTGTEQYMLYMDGIHRFMKALPEDIRETYRESIVAYSTRRWDLE